ncbi:MAG: hypothetical protein IKG87_13105 [Clostridia bacterium]|nr:hypothetical protein [Clostridia bacterium]
MKKLIALLLCICLALGMVPAVAEDAAETVITSKTFPVYSKAVGNVWREDFPVYFLNGVEDLPFINLEDWKDVLKYAYDDTDFTGEKKYDLTLETSEDGKAVTLTRETGYYMVVDFEEGTITYPDYVMFVQPPFLPYLEIGGSPETMNGEPYLLKHTQSRNLYGDITVVNLKEYDIPMVAQDGKYLLPMQTLNAFSLGYMDTSLYYNGQALYLSGIQTMQDPKDALNANPALAAFVTPDVMEKFQAREGAWTEKIDYLMELISESSEAGKQFAEEYYKSAENSLYLQYASAPDAPRSSELIRYGFNELALEMDCFYGLKEAHNITDFSIFFMQNELGAGLMDPDAAKADQAVADLTQYWFDDGHSAYISSSYLSGSGTNTNYGFTFTGSQTLAQKLTALRAQNPNAGLPYYEVGDTAYVTFDQFIATADGNNLADYYKLVKEGKDLPQDTIGIIHEAHKQITRENSPIKNVVMDLSLNGGGMAFTAFFTLGWFLGDGNYSYRNTFTGSQTTRYFRADVNLDHQFDENDTLAGRGLNLYCLISPKSFSCGNLVPWVLKSSGEVTLLGKTSGGGSCVVGFATTAWGTSYRYSSPKRLSFVKNGAYYDVDQGVEPDHVIDNYANFYDRDALTEFIHGLY